jgi:hypothetical protein
MFEETAVPLLSTDEERALHDAQYHFDSPLRLSRAVPGRPDSRARSPQFHRSHLSPIADLFLGPRGILEDTENSILIARF